MPNDYGTTLYGLVPSRIREVDESSEGMRMVCDALGVVADLSKRLVDDLASGPFPLDASDEYLARYLESAGVTSLESVPTRRRRMLAHHVSRLNRAKGTKKCVEDVLHILGYPATVHPLFSTFAYPKFGNAASDVNAAYFSDTPSSSLQDSRIVVDGVMNPEVVASRASAVETRQLGVVAASATALTLRVASTTGVSQGLNAWVEGAESDGECVVLSTTSDTVTISNGSTVPVAPGRVRFYVPGDILWASPYYDIRGTVPLDFEEWFADHSGLAPEYGSDPSGMSYEQKCEMVKKILLTQADFIEQFAPCRSEIRWATVT